MSPWSDTDFDEKALTLAFMTMIQDPNSIVITHDKGIIGGHIQPMMFGGDTVAQEMFWYAEEGGQDLLNLFEAWGQAKGVKYLLLGALTFNTRKDEIMKKKYDRMGYTPIETHYLKEVG